MSVLFVVFKVADSEYALPAESVLHLESFDGATSVPGTSDFVAGLVQTRGQVVPVVDVRARFGLPPLPRSLDSRVIVTQVGGRTTALLVDSAREVMELPAESFRDAPELLEQHARGLIKAVAQTAERLVMLINLPKLIGEKSNGE